MSAPPYADVSAPTSSIDAADALLTRLSLEWSKSLDSHVYVGDPASGFGVRPSGATLALKLCAGAVRCAIERAERGEVRP